MLVHALGVSLWSRRQAKTFRSQSSGLMLSGLPESASYIDSTFHRSVLPAHSAYFCCTSSSVRVPLTWVEDPFCETIPYGAVQAFCASKTSFSSASVTLQSARMRLPSSVFAESYDRLNSSAYGPWKSGALQTADASAAPPVPVRPLPDAVAGAYAA
ncbi:hypothetical protein COO72_00285 [Bifidobacterium callitrichos]|nr:hypothetical protein COO72_00285 [Bifidobacterium callitrichos]